MMKCLILLIGCFLHQVQGQICLFYLDTADCRYPIDGVAMTHIVGKISECNSPADVTFNLNCNNPSVSWSHTYSNDNEIADVEGFDMRVRLQVLLSVDGEERLWVRAVFIVEGQAPLSFIDERVYLRLKDCLILNTAGKIAVSVVATLLVIIAILIAVLVYMRYRARKTRHQRLVEHMEQESDSENTSASASANGGVFTTGCKRVHYLPTIPEQTEIEGAVADVSQINGHVVSNDADGQTIISGAENSITQSVGAAAYVFEINEPVSSVGQTVISGAESSISQRPRATDNSFEINEHVTLADEQTISIGGESSISQRVRATNNDFQINKHVTSTDAYGQTIARGSENTLPQRVADVYKINRHLASANDDGQIRIGGFENIVSDTGAAADYSSTAQSSDKVNIDNDKINTDNDQINTGGPKTNQKDFRINGRLTSTDADQQKAIISGAENSTHRTEGVAADSYSTLQSGDKINSSVVETSQVIFI